MSGHMCSMLTSEEISAVNQAEYARKRRLKELGVGMKIIVANRKMVEAGLFVVGTDGEIKDLPPHMVISITDPDKPCADVNTEGGIKALMRLQFWDINNLAAYEHDTRYDTFSKAMFDDVLAKRIVDFVRLHMHKVEIIICQCEAGRSRSAGVAAALAKCLTGDDTRFFKEPYNPNSLVYSRIVALWHVETPLKVRSVIAGTEPDAFIRMSFETDNKVEKVLVHEDIEIGVDARRDPVYIRVTGILPENVGWPDGVTKLMMDRAEKMLKKRYGVQNMDWKIESNGLRTE